MAGRDHGMNFAQEVLGSHLCPPPRASSGYCGKGASTAAAGLSIAQCGAIPYKHYAWGLVSGRS